MTEEQIKQEEEKTEELEKTNIALELSEIEKQVSSLISENIDLKKQLTKAKELLKRCYDNYIHLEPLRSEIEQFINSEVEK